jgi:hypothetical protein
MRWLGSLLLVVVGPTVGLAQDKAPPTRRYGVEPNLRAFPQATPKETLASVLQAIEQRRFDYLLAQLTDPPFVDDRVQRAGGKFDEVVNETRTKLQENPKAVTELRRFLKEGEWEGGDGNTASASLKDVKDRRVYFRKVDARWYLENRLKPKPPS